MLGDEARAACLKCVAQRLNREDIPDLVAENLPEDSMYYAYVVDDDGSWTELEKEVRRLLNVYYGAPVVSRPSGRGENREAPSEIAVEISDYSRNRAEAFSEAAATLADSHPEVKRFRKRYLKGRLLSDSEARTFLEKQGGASGSGLVLKLLLKRLVKSYPWQEGDALWFVLTGHIPPVRPLEVTGLVNDTSIYPGHHPNTARITITADAWVDASEVERAFRDAQRPVRGGDNKQLHERTLEVVKFVSKRMREHPEETWEKRRKEWNKEYPEWEYTTYNGLRQVFERFVHPTYNQPNYRLPKRTPYQEWEEEWVLRTTGDVDTN